MAHTSLIEVPIQTTKSRYVIQVLRIIDNLKKSVTYQIRNKPMNIDDVNWFASESNLTFEKASEVILKRAEKFNGGSIDYAY